MKDAGSRATNATDTIVAISTPPGRGGIGIVRLSGPDALAIAEHLVNLKRPLKAGRARLAEVIDHETSAVLDQAVVTLFAAPNSYTGEDVVEIAAHGSPVILDHLLRASARQGARLAEPGEFTQRAFLSGRLDLTQAEAVHGLIEATTLAQARTAAMQLGGGISRLVAPVKRQLIELIAALEAGIDFAEDDLDLMPDTEIAIHITQIAAPLAAIEATFAYGRVLRDGLRLAIVGRPNAGKSSLFNRLVGRDRSIVTASPGTTRDTVAERVDISGIPVELVDTAGLRAASQSGTPLDEAEGLGVARSREAMAEADVVLLVLAADESLHEEDRIVIAAASGRKLIVAVNKVDLIKDVVPPALANDLADPVMTSALAGIGIEALRSAILATAQATPASADTVTITNLRQQSAISSASSAIRSAQHGLKNAMPHEMLLLDLHEALAALDTLTGTTHTDEILGVIFASFCIGK